MVLTDDQSNWLKNAEDKVYQLIRETPPDGVQFAKTIEVRVHSLVFTQF